MRKQLHQRTRRMGALGQAALGVGLAVGVREIVTRSREADLRGEVALITGGSRGLGLAIARELSAEGCRLALCARNGEELERAARELRETGAEVLTHVCDVSREAEVAAMVGRVLAEYGQIDLLVANAGVIEVSQAETLEVEDFRRVMDVNFWGMLYPILAVLPGMRDRQSGRIATITSIAGKISVPRLLSYSVSKFATVGLSEGLTAELAKDGIAVTTVVPGIMRTGSHLAALFKGTDEQQSADYTWFSVGASLPINDPADRAAKIIVRAIKRGQAECAFSLPYALADRLHGLAPATTVRLMRLADALLPRVGGHGPVTIKPGGKIKERMDSKLLDAATTLAERAADDFNQRLR